VDLPFPVDGRVVGRAESWMPFEPGGGGGLEDGFDFVRNAEAMRVDDHPLRLALLPPNGEDGAGATLWLIAPEAILWRAVAPGPPGTGERRFHALRLQGDAGAAIAVWDLRGTITTVRTADAADTLLVARVDGSTDRHVAPDIARLDREAAPNTNGTASSLRASGAQDVWRVERRDTAGRIATQALALGIPPRGRAAGERTATVTPSGAERESDRGPPCLLPPDGTPLTFTLGDAHYRRSEESWRDAGAPRAIVRLSIARGMLTVEVDVQLGRAPVFVPPGAINPLDNERADVNSDGLQLLVGVPATPAHAAVSWLLVPERPAPAVRQTRTSGNTPAPALTATWRERADGWAVTIRLPLAGLAAASDVIALDLAVNERPPGRERRRGQLLLSEPDSPFVYLRGDRMDASRALRFQLPPATPVL
ncbi:MAG: hypothetical protein M3154_10075, partial [Candidatus Eremiobacteraeota bacterium]|nr:hypothetical protein [Candidatus Eremiobacteraeota bacterium]